MKDYIRADGILICGKCDTPKAFTVTVGGEVVLIPCLCKCESEKREVELEKERAEQKRIELERMKQKGFPDVELRNYTFDNDDGKDIATSEICKNYVKNFSTLLLKGKGLMFFGTVGTGKTFYAAAIVNALIERGFSAMITSCGRIAQQLMNQSNRQEFLDGLNKIELLVLDDLSAERNTEWMQEMVQIIVDGRYRAKLPTIVTTNLSADHLKNPSTIAEERLYSRLLEMCLPIKVTGNDRRKEKLKQDYLELKDLLGL